MVVLDEHYTSKRCSITGSPKVLRCKMDMMEYNFDIENIPGPDNIVAGGFSRIIEINESDVREAKGLLLPRGSTPCNSSRVLY